MPNFRRRQQSWTAKAVTISAIGMGVGFGTCGLGVLTARNAGVSRFAISAGAILFFVSLAGLVITALIALGTQIAEAFRK